MRTRMTFSPRSTHSTAVSASNTARPTAAPGEALRPLTIFVAPLSAAWSNVAQELVDVGRLDPRDRLLLRDQASSTMSTAIFTAGRRGPLRRPRLEHVQRPRSIVNSRSWTSR